MTPQKAVETLGYIHLWEYLLDRIKATQGIYAGWAEREYHELMLRARAQENLNNYLINGRTPND